MSAKATISNDDLHELVLCALSTKGTITDTSRVELVERCAARFSGPPELRAVHTGSIARFIRYRLNEGSFSLCPQDTLSRWMSLAARLEKESAKP